MKKFVNCFILNCEVAPRGLEYWAWLKQTHFLKILFILFLERGEGREKVGRNIHVREKH